MQPRTRQAELLGDLHGSPRDRAVGLDDQGVGVARDPLGVVRERHRRAADQVDVADDALTAEPLTDATERLAEVILAQEPAGWRTIRAAHTGCRSSGISKTPWRRNPAGLCTRAITRTPRLSTGRNGGKQNRSGSLVHVGGGCSSWNA